MTCPRCGERPSWEDGEWCAHCIAETCCLPARARGRVCVHHDRAIYQAG